MTVDSFHEIEAPVGRSGVDLRDRPRPLIGRRQSFQALDARTLAWILVPVAALPVFALALIADGLRSPHSFDSAVILMEARSFVATGILRLHGLPVIDNPPLIAIPSYYPNWPPLAAITLSAVLAWLGDGVRAPQILMAAFSLAIAAMIAVAFRRAHPPGIAAAATFLLTPWTMTYGFHVSMLIFGMLFGLAACLAWIAWTDSRLDGRPSTGLLLAGCGCMFLALLSSWEPFFLLPGFLLASQMTGQLRRNWRALAAYTFASVLAVVIIFGFYASKTPGFFSELGRKLLYRAGLGSYAPPFSPYWLVNDQGNFHPGLRGYLSCAIELFRHSALLGPVALTALPFAILVLVRHRKENRFRHAIHLLAPLLSMWLGWTLVFAQQAMMHEFEIGGGVMAAAASVGVVWSYLEDRLSKGGSLPSLGRSGVTAAFILALAFGAGGTIDDRMREITGREPSESVLGRLIDRSVETNGLVLTTEHSAVAAYFARRHVIRGVSDENVVIDYGSAFRDLCPDCSLYLALRSDEQERFARMLAGRQPIATDRQWTVYKLAAPGQLSLSD